MKEESVTSHATPNLGMMDDFMMDFNNENIDMDIDFNDFDFSLKPTKK